MRPVGFPILNAYLLYASRREVETAKAQALRYREDAERLQTLAQRGADSEHAMAQAHIEKMESVTKKLEKSKQELLHQRESEVASLAKQRQEANDMERQLRATILVKLLLPTASARIAHVCLGPLVPVGPKFCDGTT